MKTIQKILWGFISTAICLLYRTDVKGVTNYPEYTGHLYATIDGVYVYAKKTSTRCYATDKPNLRNNTNAMKIINSALNAKSVICSGFQYVDTCNGVPAYLTTADCKRADKIICSHCPKKTGGYGSALHQQNAYKVNYREIPASVATGCMDVDNTYSYIVNFYVVSQVIIDANSITDCFVPSLTTYKDDPTGVYEFTNSCYYTEQ